ncbi:MAG: hypothetical protein GXY55_02970 [Phycisphaerae bacterium]|nr:hypothetical protein [Phycisphaerae bacterium]
MRSLCLLWFALAASTAGASSSLSDLTGPWILVVDDHPIASKTQVTRTYHPFQKHLSNPVLPGDEPWEHDLVYVYGTSLPNESGQGYRLWYHGLPAAHETQVYRLMYATSDDGVHWDKPALGIVDWFGSTANNIFLRRTNRDHIPSIIHTPWDPDPQKRYRMINWDSIINAYLGAYSADGIHWTDSPANPLLRSGGDVGQFVWDPHTQRYLGYLKVNPDVRGMRRRAVGFTATTNFESWSSPTLILAPDDFDDRWAYSTFGPERTHFYGMSAFPYESMYLGFLWVFRATDPEGYHDGPIFVELVTSHDGVNWLRQEGNRPPILELGPPRSWDDGMLFTTNHPIVEGNTIRLYYGGCDGLHAGPISSWIAGIGLATLRKDGFASLDAGSTPGTVITKRLANVQGPLRVNANAAGGSLAVEVLDEQGNAVPGYAAADCLVLQADAVDTTISWTGYTELPTSYPTILLRFILQNASLYSFMAGDNATLLDEPDAVMLESLYTFEGYTGTTAVDQRWLDGTQAMTFWDAAVVEADPAHVRFGQHAARLSDPATSAGSIEIADTTDLSTQFTLAAFVQSADNQQARLFSNDDGNGNVGTSELILSFDPTGTTLPGLRLTCKGIVVNSLPYSFADGGYHHLAVTYNQGSVTFHIDGMLMGQGRVGGGAPVLLARNLRVGRDALPDGYSVRQFYGWVDDVLVIRRALSPEEVTGLALNGAAAFFGIGVVAGDLNQDATVDEVDCGILREGLRLGLGDPQFIPVADYDADGRLTCADADAWMAAYRVYVGDPDAQDPCGLLDPTDSDRDGIRDLCDFCPATVLGAAVDAYGCPPRVPGDMDGDGDVDLTDFGFIQTCLTGPYVLVTEQACVLADLNSDRRVDYRDLAIFRNCVSGGDIVADPCCDTACE